MRNRQPDAYHGINYADALSRGLQIAICGTQPVNHVDGQVWRGAASKIPSQVGSPDGLCYVANGTQDNYLSAPAAHPRFFPASYTVFALVPRAVSDTTLSTRILALQDAAHTFQIWEMTKVTDDRFYFGIRDSSSGTSKTSPATSPVITAGARYTVIGQYSSTKVDVVVNGVRYSSSVTTAQNGFTADPPVFGGLTWAARSIKSPVAVALMWDYWLPDNLLEQLIENPYRMFI